MKTLLKFVVIALVAMTLVVPVSAKTASPSAGIAGPDVVPNLVDWYDNWDSYPTNQNMHGIGGWKGWGNAPGATAYTRDTYSISVPNSIDINGASDLVHEYAIDAGVWTYTAWQFVPTSFNGITYFILLNQYDDPGYTNNWSVQVSFDSGTNLVTNDGGAGGTLPLIKGEWVEIRVEIDLDADTQSFYYGGDLLFSGSWSEGMSGGGITSIGAVDLFANGATPVYYDDLSLVEPGVDEPMHIGEIFGAFRQDPLGRTQLLMGVQVHNANHVGLGGVAVDATITPPQGGAYSRTRMTRNSTGVAHFHWGSNYTGTWELCVNNLTLPGFVYVPGDNDVPACGNWFN